jgi:hypothetical protein
MEHFDDGDKIKELSYLIGFGNIFCVIKQENLDSKLYKDFIIIEIDWTYSMNKSKESSEIVIIGL